MAEYFVEFKQKGCRAGGRAGSGVAMAEIAARAPRQIVTQKMIWERWGLYPLEAGGKSIVTILSFL